MKVWMIGLLLLISSPAWAQRQVPQIPFDSVPNFLKLPADMYLGEVSGVAVNSKGHVFVFQRGSTNGPAYAAAGWRWAFSYASSSSWAYWCGSAARGFSASSER